MGFDIGEGEGPLCQVELYRLIAGASHHHQKVGDDREREQEEAHFNTAL